MRPSDAGLEWPREYGSQDVGQMNIIIGDILVHPVIAA